MVGSVSFPVANARVDHRGSTEVMDAPPSYQASTTPLPISRDQSTQLVAETTTVTTTTRTLRTTTQLFSLPVWRRRPATPKGTDESRGLRLGVGEDGRMLRSRSLNVDKELPSVPTSENEAGPSRLSGQSALNLVQQATSSRHGALDEQRPQSIASLPRPKTPSKSPYQQPTRVLAQAALGLGLPHVMPEAPPPFAGQNPTPDVRRAKSISRLRSESSVSNLRTTLRRDRDRDETSGSGSASRGGESSQQRREVEESNEESSPVGAHPLSRRPSFWNRRRVQSMKTLEPDTSVIYTPVPSLPAVQPTSPFFVEGQLHDSPDPSPSAQALSFSANARLTRRHSERSERRPSAKPSLNDNSHYPDPPPVPGRSAKRPSTAQTIDSISSASAYEHGLHTSNFSRVQRHDLSNPNPSPVPRPLPRTSRPRSMTNPSNLLHRFSMGFFSPTAPTSPISSPTISTNFLDDRITKSPQLDASPPKSSLSRSSLAPPKPLESEDSPELFLARIEEAVSKAEIANVLATSPDPFYMSTLQLYISRFDFTSDPLDVAVRRLLVDVGLPKETQQIDRVMEAFAARYLQCNPGLFISPDHPYILAFSLIMLHTDAFNKSNKKKMTKADYIKNTKLVGVSSAVLDCFFDNIVFAPFIFIEDPVDVNGQRGLLQDHLTSRLNSSTGGYATPDAIYGTTSLLGRSPKLDPYFLITKNLLGALRIDVETYIPVRNPYSYQGTAGSWNESELRRSFARADIIELDTAESKRVSTLPFFTPTVGGPPGHMTNGFAGSPEVVLEPDGSPIDASFLRVTKVGVLNRKDDTLDGGKRASSRKWRECSLILTGSQLLFFRETSLALDLMSQMQQQTSASLQSQLSLLRPDELLSVKEAMAVYDASYSKHANTFRLVLPTGRQLLLGAESERQRNEWIAHINYASAFKTAGIRMRPLTDRLPASVSPVPASHSTLSGSEGYPSPPMPQNINDSRVRDSSVLSPLVRQSSESPGRDQSRTRIVGDKIGELETRISATQTQLDAEMRLVKNLAVLTPFQRATRERVLTAVINVSRTIKQLRLDFIKGVCHRDVLAADLNAELTELRERSSSPDRRRRVNVPRMTLSVHDDSSLPQLPFQSSSYSEGGDDAPPRPESSICESFHSALDFTSEWPSHPRSPLTKTTAPSQSLEQSSSRRSHVSTARLPDIPSAMADSSLSTLLPLDNTSFASDPSSHRDSFEERNGRDREGTDECAEDWDKTRAAKRVSLVNVPTNLPPIQYRKGSSAIPMAVKTIEGRPRTS